MQTMKFVLKQYDTALLSFDLRSKGLDGFACTRHTGRRGMSALRTPPTKEDDIRDLDAYAKTRTPYFGSSFDELATAFMADLQRKQLRKLIDFRFTRELNYNLPAKRLKALESFLQRRTRYLSEVSK